VFPAWAYDFGRPATPDEIKLWDIDVRPDGTGLPQGSGTVAHGKEVYRDNCEVCHGTNGEGGIKDRLVGGEGSLASPLKTVGSYWPYATTVFVCSPRNAASNSRLAERRRHLRCRRVVSRRGCVPVRRSCWSAAAIRPARPRCFSRG
jgi:Cytochrome c